MKLFIVGDYYSNTGPANVTLRYIEEYKKQKKPYRHLVSKNKFLRAAELLWKLPGSSLVLFSGYSMQNIYGMRLARFFRKPCFYLMHGCVEHEDIINRVPDERMKKGERKMLALADRILAVSEEFERWLKENYPEYREKITHLTNGVDWDVLERSAAGEAKKPLSVISVGGGMPRKRILNICRALERLREEEKYRNLILTVAGDTGADSVAINSYSFVNNVGKVSHEELIRLYGAHKLFVQNSVFESFGLAPLEALLCNTDVLISSVCGALSVFGETEEGDLIRDPENIEELAEKIRALLDGENHTRLLVEIDRRATSWEARLKDLEELCKTVS
ncbi:MAG: glycosyltransferase family 4 protein [Lachnospiraceae bacterium]|nr:glycosyltransferase family 4 protein [Lachnospiraceae bacterium]